ncbi:MAG: CotH kinase family protein [Ilumatobacter sp.]
MFARRPIVSTLGGSLAITTFMVAAPATSGTVVAASPRDVVVNEIMYHPEDDDPNGEFLELANRTDRAINLSGWCIDGVDFCFPGARVLPAGGFVLTTSAEWSGRLSNGGEDLALIDPAGTVIDEFEYDDKGKWPANADGNGASLQRRRTNVDGDDPGNWFGGRSTPGRANLGRGAPYLTIDDVEHTESPAPGQAIELTAEAPGATAAEVEYVIGFGPTRTIAADVDADGALRATIPGQAAGELVRYRWVTTAPSRIGTWPRQGDGMTYTGTVVASPPGSTLPRFQWFMEDAIYEVARQDLSLSGDDGYPAVFAFDGQVFDNTVVRVKGQTSRFWPKKKWKFVLPDGHDLEIDGVTEEDVDEFSLHSSWSDKSFLREILSAEFLDDVGLPVSQTFPVRLERNGQFFGAYTYVEQRDGTFRDRQDFGDATVYEVGGNFAFGDMAASHAGLSEQRLRNRYDKDTNEFENDDELRDLIRLINQPSIQRRAQLIEERIDASTIINTIAANMAIQHQDWGLKNYDLRLTEQGMWAIAPTDFDLTWGRRPDLSCGGLCDEVVIGGAFEHPGQPLFAAFWFNPYYRAKITQRVRTIADEHFVPARWNARVNGLRDEVISDARLDRQVWGTYKSSQDPATAASQLIDRFINPQHRRLLGTLVRQGRVAPFSQPANPRVAITDVRYDGTDAAPAHVVLTNFDGVPVDISGFEIEEIGFTATGGTILNPGESAIAFHEDAESVRGRLNGMLFAGLFDDEPSDADDGFALTDRQGDRLSERTEIPPGAITTIDGRAGESAFLNVSATETNSAGFLQVVDCDADPGVTSNLNIDSADQTRAVAAIGAFDDDGELCVYNSTAAHIIVDVAGYFSNGAIDDVDDVRLLDSRKSGGPIRAGRTVTLTGRPGASAFLNLVSVGASGPGFVQVVPCDVSPGASSNLNVDAARQVRSGLAVARFDELGEVCVFTTTTSHLVVDLQAYLTDGSLDDVDDERLVDTRTTPGKPADGAIIRFSGRPASTAFVSLTLTESSRPGYAQLVPCGGPVGETSNVNVDARRQTIANLAVVEFDTDGEACLFVVMSTHVVVDLQGYLEDDAFDDIADTRLVDTR